MMTHTAETRQHQPDLKVTDWGGLSSSLAAEDFSTDRLAEQLPYGALLTCLAYRRSEKYIDAIDNTKPQTDLELAWLQLEAAMCAPDDDAAKDHFDDAKVYAGRVLANEQRRASHDISARRLQTYHAKFRERRNGSSHKASRSTVVAKTIESLEVAKDYTIHHNDDARHFEQDHTPCFGSSELILGTRIKLATELLLLRAGYDIYGASLREGGYFMNRTLIPAHDGYVIDEKLGKIPFRARFGNYVLDRRGDKGNLILPYSGIAKYALEEMLQRDEDAAEWFGSDAELTCVKDTVDLLALDARNPALLQPEDKRLLNCMTERAVLLLENYREVLAEHAAGLG